ncbi:hypothetical protein C4K23_5575 [Pseudomonas chlororaphis]|nr:hypothetical protein C4K23_5575 [Pseudomonas chlororaphis]
MCLCSRNRNNFQGVRDYPKPITQNQPSLNTGTQQAFEKALNFINQEGLWK